MITSFVFARFVKFWLTTGQKCVFALFRIVEPGVFIKEGELRQGLGSVLFWQVRMWGVFCECENVLFYQVRMWGVFYECENVLFYQVGMSSMNVRMPSSNRWECEVSSMNVRMSSSTRWECEVSSMNVRMSSSDRWRRSKKGASINGQFREAFDGNFLGKKSFDGIFANCPNVAVAVSPLYNLLARHEGVRCVILRIYI